MIGPFHHLVKRFVNVVVMGINTKKFAIQLRVETPLQESLQDIPRLDETTYKYLGYEMKKGDVEIRDVMDKLEARIKDKEKEPTLRVEVLAVKKVHFINQNVMCGIRFYSGPDKFNIGWLDKIDRMVRQHLTQQGMLLERGVETSRLFMSPDDMGFRMKSCFGVYLLELVRLLKYKWGTILRQEWFRMMEEVIMRRGKGVRFRETRSDLEGLMHLLTVKSQLSWPIGLPIIWGVRVSPFSGRQPNAVWRCRARIPHTHNALTILVRT